FGVGMDIGGNVIVADIARMPHMLVAGATGSGKSVCINTLICSILYKYSPKDVKMIMIDPKMVELSVYNDIPHLLIPVVTNMKKAPNALNWAVAEMNRRYKLFAESKVKDINGYNEKFEERLPRIVLIIDELADLMMVSPNEIEDAICRLAQMARACGIHLVIATQRPSVDVITGLIKANIPSRIAFSVSSQTDSRTILDTGGAEKLLGRGDMLYYPMGANKPVRIQGAFISENEVIKITDFIKEKNNVDIDNTEIIQEIEKIKEQADNPEDELITEILDFIKEKEQASTSLLQRKFRIGYNRASRIIDDLEQKGIVGPSDGVKPRKVYIENIKEK
nr:DNA translocase FtsK [Acetoanaerobium sp.]